MAGNADPNIENAYGETPEAAAAWVAQSNTASPAPETAAVDDEEIALENFEGEGGHPIP